MQIAREKKRKKLHDEKASEVQQKEIARSEQESERLREEHKKRDV